MFTAITTGNIALAKALLKKEVDVNREEHNYFGFYGAYKRRTPLLFACEYGELEIARLLIEHGADPNKTDYYGNSPLDIACLNSKVEIVNLLLQQKNLNIKPVFEERETECCINILKYFFILPPEKIDLTLVKYRKKNQIKINEGVIPSSIKKEFFQILLHAAVSNGHTAIIKLLHEHGADINCKNHYGKTPLVIAAENGYVDTVTFLLDNGASIDMENPHIEPIIFSAAKNGHTKIVKLLMKKYLVSENRENLTNLLKYINENDLFETIKALPLVQQKPLLEEVIYNPQSEIRKKFSGNSNNLKDGILDKVMYYYLITEFPEIPIKPNKTVSYKIPKKPNKSHFFKNVEKAKKSTQLASEPSEPPAPLKKPTTNWWESLKNKVKKTPSPSKPGTDKGERYTFTL